MYFQQIVVDILGLQYTDILIVKFNSIYIFLFFSYLAFPSRERIYVESWKLQVAHLGPPPSDVGHEGPTDIIRFICYSFSFLQQNWWHVHMYPKEHRSGEL